MAEHYVWIKHFHGHGIPDHCAVYPARPVPAGRRRKINLRLRKITDRISYGVDSLLLIMGILLLVILQLNPITTAWLSSKLGFLVAYVILGVFAFRDRLPMAGRWLCFALAIGCWVLMFLTAKKHLPLWMW